MQVPKLTTPQVQVKELPSGNASANAPIEAFGGGSASSSVAQAGQILDHEVRSFSLQQENHANEVAVTAATTAAIQKKNALLYGSTDSSGKRIPGLMDMQGQNAFGAPEQIGGEYQKFHDETVDSLSNDRQKAMFQHASGRIGLDLSEAIQKHVYVESKKYDDQVTKSGIEAAQDDAISNYQQPHRVEGAIQDQIDLVVKNAQRNGMPTTLVGADGKPTVTGMLVKNSVSTTHSKVIDQMLANDQDQAASQYYKKWKGAGQITGEDSTRLDKNLEEGSLRGNSQRLTDKYTKPILNDAGQVTSQPTMQEALEKVSSISDPKLRDATSARVKDYYATQKAAQNQSREQTFESAWNTVAQSKSMDSIPPATLQSLSPSQQKALSGALQMTETNPEKFYQFQRMASDPSQRAAFMKLGYSDLRPHLSDSDMKQVGSWQAGLQKQDTATANKLDGYRTDSSIVNDSLNAAGYKVTAKPGTADAKAVALFRTKVDQNLAQIQERTGKKATNQQVQETVDKLLVNTITDRGFLWNTTKRAFELTSGDTVEVDLKDIPKAEVNKIKDSLQRNNRPVNDASVVDIYKRKLQQDAQ